MILDIIVGVCAFSIVFGVLFRYIYKRTHHMPTGECACCKSKMQLALKKASKDLKKSRA